MAKIHPIETCIGCGGAFMPLIRDNKKQWDNFRAFVAKRLSIPEAKYIDLLSPRLMIHEKSDVIYFLCADCCKDALGQFLTQIITRHRRLLFQNFDKIRKELKDGI